MEISGRNGVKLIEGTEHIVKIYILKPSGFRLYIGQRMKKSVRGNEADMENKKKYI